MKVKIPISTHLSASTVNYHHQRCWLDILYLKGILLMAICSFVDSLSHVRVSLAI